MAKANVLVATKDMPRETWLEYRKQGIGGSDVAAIAGLNPWRSPMAVWLEKTGQIEPQKENEAMYWGAALEDIVAQEFSKRTGLKVHRKNFMLQHPEYPFMLANIDREILDPDKGRGILECKTTSGFNTKDWENGEIPDYYMLQVQHYLAVTGLPYAYLAVLIGGQMYQYTYIPRDDEIIGYLIDIETEFWSLVENETPPEIDGTAASEELLKKLYPDSNGTTVTFTSDMAEILQQYDEAKTQEKYWAEKKKEAENKIKGSMGEAGVGIFEDRKITWKPVTSYRIDTNRLKAERPDIYEEFANPVTYRRFVVK